MNSNRDTSIGRGFFSLSSNSILPSWRSPLVFLLLVSTLVFSATGVLGQVEEGTIISSENLGNLSDETFEGHTIDSLITPGFKMMIEEQNLKIQIKHSRDLVHDPRWVKATQKYKGQASVDPQSKKINNYTAGVPFPGVNKEDDLAGWKVAYNDYYGWNHGNYQSSPFFTFLFVGGNAGLERAQNWNFQVLYQTGLNSWEGVNSNPSAHTIGDGSIRLQQFIFAVAPYDIKGVGTYTIRYEDGSYDDTWAYLRSVRRTRRLTGGAWMDPIDGTDQRNDEIDVISPFPTWYKDWKYVEKKTVLLPMWTTWPTVNEQANEPARKYPAVTIGQDPAWNPKPGPVKWEPMEVDVIEAIPPKEHPIKRKILYCTTAHSFCMAAENYDRQGDLFKMTYSPQHRIAGYVDAPGGRIPNVDSQELSWVSSLGFMIHFKRNHGTIYLHNKDAKFGDIPNTIGPEDFNLDRLRRGEPVSP